jgi:hypothetical protein
VEYKKDQNWVTKSGDYLVFPGGGTQFKTGVTRYIQFIEQTLRGLNTKAMLALTLLGFGNLNVGLLPPVLCHKS